MKNSSESAFPYVAVPYQSEHTNNPGLTKRELIAAMAMQGLLANMGSQDNALTTNIARWAVDYADALLIELEKSNNG